jgi:mitofusin 1
MTSSDGGLEHLLRDRWLHSVIDEVLVREIPTAEVYESLTRALAVEELVVPVVGVQGSGKSTMLSGLLFDRPVLPTDVDETTCVPTEIRWGERLAAEAEYHDGRVEPIEPSENALARLVHNEHNPGNQLGLRCLRVRVEEPLLKNGLVLVDLPGLGSLTPENQETTEHYVRSCAALLVLLRTTPPLTRHEATVVGTLWPLVPHMLFVQNRWTDESLEEADEGREYSCSRLRQLAERIHVAPGPDAPNIEVVCAYETQVARFRGSGRSPQLDGLVGTLSRLASSWQFTLQSAVRVRLGMDIGEARQRTGEMLTSLAADRADVELRRAELRARFDEFQSDLRGRRADGIALIETATGELKEFTRTWRRETKQRLRNAMRTKIRGGIVDGGMLDAAFAQEQEEYLDALIDHCQARIADLRTDLEERFSNVPDWDPTRAAVVEEVGLEEKTKFESRAPDAMGAAGGVGAAVAFTALGGAAAIGAKVGGVIGLSGGPAVAAVGAVAGALVGVLGYFAGKAVGWGIKKLAAGGREKRARDAVFPLIDDFVEQVYEGFRGQLDEVEERFESAVDSWMGRETARYEEHRQAELRVHDLDLGAKERESARLATQLGRLRELASVLEGASRA